MNLAGTTDTIEKSVQTFFEKNLEALLGVRFLASEFTTSNGGRIDTLGVDENGCPRPLLVEVCLMLGGRYAVIEQFTKSCTAGSNILRPCLSPRVSAVARLQTIR
jgi:hypothetical protein